MAYSQQSCCVEKHILLRGDGVLNSMVWGLPSEEVGRVEEVGELGGSKVAPEDPMVEVGRVGEVGMLDRRRLPQMASFFVVGTPVSRSTYANMSSSSHSPRRESHPFVKLWEHLTVKARP